MSNTQSQEITINDIALLIGRKELFILRLLKRIEALELQISAQNRANDADGNLGQGGG
jgi:hypothetical protein